MTYRVAAQLKISGLPFVVVEDSEVAGRDPVNADEEPASPS